MNFVIIEEESEESSEESDEVDEDGYVVYSAQKVRHKWPFYVSLVYNTINTSGTVDNNTGPDRSARSKGSRSQ